MRSNNLNMHNWCRRTRLAVLLLLAGAAVVAYASKTSAAIIYYDPSSGSLTLNDSGANYDSNLQGFVVNIDFATSSGTLFSPSISWSPTASWTASALATSDQVDYSWNANRHAAAPTAGIYTLALLPPGLTASAFGYDGGAGYPYGPGNTYGAWPYSAVTFGDNTGTNFPDFMHFRVLPSEVDWIGGVDASWNNTSFWNVPAPRPPSGSPWPAIRQPFILRVGRSVSARPRKASDHCISTAAIPLRSRARRPAR